MSAIRTSRRANALVIFAALALLANRAQSAPLKAGDIFPELKPELLEGAGPAVTGKVVVVDFWASWCAPCKKSFPELEKIHADYKDKGVLVIGVNVDEKASDMQKFLAEQNVSFAIVRDKAQKLIAAVGVQAMPTSFILDRTGKIRAVHRGFKGQETVTELRKELDAILAEGAAK